ncbi:MAG: 3-phosphoserine/phosphohydroxythreonine transaminase [Bradymonadia bacterium]|jgi:phosphoserine aminotransferase
MKRVFNFSAGPSVLPQSVLERAASEMLNYHDTGQSVMEMSHRSKAYDDIIRGSEDKLRELMGIPDNFSVLFLQGGASLQFCMLVLNLKRRGRAAYIDTGVWSQKAIQEAQRWLEVDVLASSKDRNYSYIPQIDSVAGDYDYVHITQNNTIMGTKWASVPDTGSLPLVSDISSCILSEPIDIERYGLLYAGGQKNLAPAGVTVVIIRNDLIREDLPSDIASMLRYDTHAKNGSMYNTPPTYSIYVMGLVLDWIKANGGAQGMLKRNQSKAKLLYDYLDASSYYHSPVGAYSRSLMNIPFLLCSENSDKVSVLNKKFVSEAAAAGLVNLGGHRSIGGMRASIYNAMPIEGVEALIRFMDVFAKENPL